MDLDWSERPGKSRIYKILNERTRKGWFLKSPVGVKSSMKGCDPKRKEKDNTIPKKILQFAPPLEVWKSVYLLEIWESGGLL